MKYKTILVDPPWESNIGKRKVRKNQVALPYKTISVSEISNLPVGELADVRCHLYFWTTHRYLPLAFDIAWGWGFKYHCLLTWDKTYGFTPMSFMFSTEFCLFCQKPGMWLKPKKRGEKVLIREKPSGHSRKPIAMYELIERVSYEPRIELFAREKREGWDAWGDEVESDIVFP